MIARVGIVGRVLGLAVALGASTSVSPGVANAAVTGDAEIAARAVESAQRLDAAGPGHGDLWSDEARSSEYWALVRDARGDSDRGIDGRAPAAAQRLSDFTKVTYKTPKARGGDLKIDMDWVVWRRGNALLQSAVTLLQTKNSNRGWAIVQTRNDVRVFVLPASDGEDVEHEEIAPAQVFTGQLYGPDGSTQLRMSTEWLNARRVSVQTIAFAGREEKSSLDVSPGRIMRVGPRPS